MPGCCSKWLCSKAGRPGRGQLSWIPGCCSVQVQRNSSCKVKEAPFKQHEPQAKFQEHISLTSSSMADLDADAFWTCRGREVWFLKRAQIFAGDVWGAFQVGSGQDSTLQKCWIGCVTLKSLCTNGSGEE